MLLYKEPIITFYKDSGIKYDIDTRKINKALIKYNNKKITEDKFSQKYSVFINNFDKFSKAIKKKQLGARDPNQKKLLDYRKKLKEIVRKSFNTSGSGLKMLTPQQMLTRLAILLAQIKAGNNSRELKNKIRLLFYSLYQSKKISKTVYKNLIARLFKNGDNIYEHSKQQNKAFK